MTTMSRAGILFLLGLVEHQILFFYPENIVLFAQKWFSEWDGDYYFHKWAEVLRDWYHSAKAPLWDQSCWILVEADQ